MAEEARSATISSANPSAATPNSRPRTFRRKNPSTPRSSVIGRVANRFPSRLGGRMAGRRTVVVLVEVPVAHFVRRGRVQHGAHDVRAHSLQHLLGLQLHRTHGLIRTRHQDDPVHQRTQHHRVRKGPQRGTVNDHVIGLLPQRVQQLAHRRRIQQRRRVVGLRPRGQQPQRRRLRRQQRPLEFRAAPQQIGQPVAVFLPEQPVQAGPAQVAIHQHHPLPHFRQCQGEVRGRRGAALGRTRGRNQHHPHRRAALLIEQLGAQIAVGLGMRRGRIRLGDERHRLIGGDGHRYHRRHRQPQLLLQVPPLPHPAVQEAQGNHRPEAQPDAEQQAQQQQAVHGRPALGDRTIGRIALSTTWISPRVELTRSSTTAASTACFRRVVAHLRRLEVRRLRRQNHRAVGELSRPLLVLLHGLLQRGQLLNERLPLRPARRKLIPQLRIQRVVSHQHPVALRFHLLDSLRPPGQQVPYYAVLVRVLLSRGRPCRARCSALGSGPRSPPGLPIPQWCWSSWAGDSTLFPAPPAARSPRPVANAWRQSALRNW